MNKPADKQANRIVIDQQGAEYLLTGLLAEGGQGKVCTTNHKNVLVKVSKYPDTDPKAIAWNNKLQWVTRQNLAGLRIAWPRTLIVEPRRGYVMELMDGLEPLQGLIDQARAAIDEKRGLQGFLRSGGLRRRVSLMAKLARLLADLHGRALVYGDLSPENVFVSKSADHSEVWLIDCDNISAMMREGGQKIYTPDYGAPEIIRGDSGIDSLTESWSFAVLAYQFLSLSHPLKGDLVEHGTPEMEESALRGELPWIGNQTDTRNSSSVGLSSDMVLTPRLFSLFDQCFAAGMHVPGERPSMAEWAEAFEAAAALCIDCGTDEGCGSSFYFNTRHQCPFCDTVQDDACFLSLRHMVCAPYAELGMEAGQNEIAQKDIFLETDYLEILSNQPLTLRSSPAGTATYVESLPVCQLQLIDSGLEILPLNGRVITIAAQSESSKSIPIEKRRVLNSDKKCGRSVVLHIGDVGKTHAVWQFVW